VSAKPQPFDPYAILAALERQRVTYILIGGFARIIQGTEELTDGLDLVPSLRPENVRRLGLALDDLDARLPNGKRPALDRDILTRAVLELRTDGGELKIVPEPAGTRGGYDDLRRAASREPDRQRPPALGRLIRRPRPHARGSRPRAGPTAAPTAPNAGRARAQPHPRDRTLIGCSGGSQGSPYSTHSPR
jgi:hypothetical protein